MSDCEKRNCYCNDCVHERTKSEVEFDELLERLEAQQATIDELQKALTELGEERDQYHEEVDRLKKRLGLVWPPAMEYMEEHIAEVDKLREQLAQKNAVIEKLAEELNEWAGAPIMEDCEYSDNKWIEWAEQEVAKDETI